MRKSRLKDGVTVGDGLENTAKFHGGSHCDIKGEHFIPAHRLTINNN